MMGSVDTAYGILGLKLSGTNRRPIRLQVLCGAWGPHLKQDFRSIEELQTGCTWKPHMSGALVVETPLGVLVQRRLRQ